MAKRGRPRKNPPPEALTSPVVGSPEPPVPAPAVPEESGTEQRTVIHQPIEIIPKAHNRCPHCGSIRSRLVATVPGDDGRMEWRRCKVCCRPFKVWDCEWRKSP